MKLNKHVEFLKIVVVVLILFFVNVNYGETPDQTHQKFQIIFEIKNDKNSPFYIDFANFPKKREALPIGIFDSGTGGLTVLSSILTLDKFNNKTLASGEDGIPDFCPEYFVYLGDKANMPYGRYDAEGKSDFLRELIIKDVQFLLGRKYDDSPTNTQIKTDKKPVKAIAIACNTATAFGLDLIKKSLELWELDVKVFGIIDAGSEAAVELLAGRSKGHTIGVLATEGTCATNGYPKSIKKYFSSVFQHNDIAVIQQAGFGLAAAIDGDMNYINPGADKVRGKEKYYGPGLDHPTYPIDMSRWKEYNFNTGNGLLTRKDANGKLVEIELNLVSNYIKYHVTQMVVEMANRYPNRRLDCVILGCTHYPFFEKEIRDHFIYLKHLNDTYDRIIPENLTLVDPAFSLAIELYEYLSQNHLIGSGSKKNSEFYISVPNPHLAENQINEAGEFPYSYKYGRSINTGHHFVKRVPFSTKWIKKDVLMRIKTKMPDIYKMIFNPRPGDRISPIDKNTINKKVKKEDNS